MRYFESKQIHSSCSSFSTDDVFVVREVDKDKFLLHAGEKAVSRKYGFSVAYVEDDKKFYHQPFFSHTPRETVLAYAAEAYLAQGWTINQDHPFLAPAQTAHYADEEERRVARRVKQGYVLPKWSKDMPPEAYQGGFSDEVFNAPELFDYVKSGGCHGFIGHSVRKPKLDAYLEGQFLKANPDKALFAMWLTSTGGRHFGDSLEGCSFKEQKAYIRKRTMYLVEQALRYDEDNNRRRA